MLAVFMLLGVCSSYSNETASNFGNDIILQVEYTNPKESLGGHPRTPIRPPHVSLDSHTLYISGVHSGYTLYLIGNLGDEPEVVYQVIIPEGMNSVVLPADITGTYELQLHNGGAYYFYCEIIL